MTEGYDAVLRSFPFFITHRPSANKVIQMCLVRMLNLLNPVILIKRSETVLKTTYLSLCMVSSSGGYSSDISNADMIRNTSAPGECFINCSSIVIEQTSSAYTIVLYFTTDNTKIFSRLRVKWFRYQVPYYPNSNASFNFMELCITLSGDVHPLPGPDNVKGRKVPVYTGNQSRKYKTGHGRVSDNCIRVQLTNSRATKHGNQNKLLKIAHLNAQSLKCRHRFLEIKEMASKKDFDVLSFSETWFNSTVSNASIEIEGYRVYRLDRIGKTGGGVCAYIKNNLKAKILKDLTGISESGFHQLWLQVQNKKLRSILVYIAYRPEIGLECLQNDLMPNYVEALSLNRDIVLTGDMNCNLLTDNPKGNALRSFCADINSTQLIDKPTRVTKTSSTLVDVVMVSNPELVKTSDVIDLTISNHFLVFAVLNLKQPKASPSYIITRSFKNYSSEKFANDISTIPWDVLDLLPTVDEKLDAFNDLFLTCLDKHAPVKKIRIKHKACPFMTDDIKQLIITRNSLHRSARLFGSPNEWKAFSEKKREVKLATKSAEIAYYNKQVTENKNHSASIWKTIRQALPQKAAHSVHYTKDTDVLTEEFNKFFISVGETAAPSAANLASAYGLATKEVTPRVFDTSTTTTTFISYLKLTHRVLQFFVQVDTGRSEFNELIESDCH